MDFLLKALLFCVIVGGIQWMVTHPDAAISQQAFSLWQIIKLKWAWAVDYAENWLRSARQ